MSEVVTYKEVEKAVGSDKAMAAWREIGSLTGAGHIPLDVDGDSVISGVSPEHQTEIAKIMGKKDKKVEVTN